MNLDNIHVFSVVDIPVQVENRYQIAPIVGIHEGRHCTKRTYPSAMRYNYIPKTGER